MIFFTPPSFTMHDSAWTCWAWEAMSPAASVYLLSPISCALFTLEELL